MRKVKMVPTPNDTAIQEWADQQIARLTDPVLP
jgi:hypothetical protein